MHVELEESRGPSALKISLKKGGQLLREKKELNFVIKLKQVEGTLNNYTEVSSSPLDVLIYASLYTGCFF